MKKVVGLLVAVALVLSCTSTPETASRQPAKGEVRQFKVPSSLPGIAATSAVSVYLPGGYGTSRAPYPVLYLMHGSGGTDMTFLGLGYEKVRLMSEANASLIVDRLVEEGKIKPLIVVCPDMTTVDQDYLVRDLIPFVDKSFRTVRTRASRAIAGHSSGGFDALSAALAHPDVFSVACGLSSAGLGGLTFRLGDAAKTLAQKALSVRFWLYVGKNDPFGMAPDNSDFVAALRQNGLPVEYIEDEGDHYDRVALRLEEAIQYCSALFK